MRAPSTGPGRRNPLPSGSVPVGLGLVVMGGAAYAFLVVAARAVDATAYSRLSVLWALVFLVGPGFFLPLEQEVGRAVAARRARGIGGGPVVRRAATAGLLLVAGLSLVTYAAWDPIAERLFGGDRVLVVALVVGFVGYAVQHLLRGALAGNGSFGRYGALLAGDGVVRIVACVGLAAAGVAAVGPYGIVLAAAPLVTSVVVGATSRGLAPPGPPAPWRELSSALVALLTASVFAQFLVNAGPLAVQLLAGADEQAAAGRFLAGLILARAPLFAFQAVQAAFLPQLAAFAGTGRHAEFRSATGRLLGVLVGVSVATVVVCVTAGPALLRWLFGPDLVLPARDLGLLAAASGAYMVALALAQALIALQGYGRVVLGWGLGIAAFAIGTAVAQGLLWRVEIGYLIGSLVAATSLFGLLLERASRTPAPSPAPPRVDVWVEP